MAKRKYASRFKTNKAKGLVLREGRKNPNADGRAGERKQRRMNRGDPRPEPSAPAITKDGQCVGQNHKGKTWAKEGIVGECMLCSYQRRPYLLRVAGSETCRGVMLRCPHGHMGMNSWQMSPGRGHMVWGWPDTVQPCSGMGIVSVFRSERKHATVANSIVEPEGRQTR